MAMSEVDRGVRAAMIQAATEKEVTRKLSLARQFGEDVFEDGTVFTLEKVFSEDDGAKRYRYATIKTGGKWYLTGSMTQGLEWYELVIWMVTGVPVVGWTRLEPVQIPPMAMHTRPVRDMPQA